MLLRAPPSLPGDQSGMCSPLQNLCAPLPRQGKWRLGLLGWLPVSVSRSPGLHVLTQAGALPRGTLPPCPVRPPTLIPRPFWLHRGLRNQLCLLVLCCSHLFPRHRGTESPEPR